MTRIHFRVARRDRRVTNGLRNFDVNTNQFGLNMIELVADKSVDTTNRVGYHVALGFGQAMYMVNSASPT